MTTTLGGLVLVTPPAEEPVSLDEMKQHLRVDIMEDDLLIESLITTAREYVEMFTRRQLVTAEWGLTLDEWPACIRPPRPPLMGVMTLAYTDSAGQPQTLDPARYQVDMSREPGRILPAHGTSWPAVQPGPGAVQLLYQAGYGAAVDVPHTFKAAIKLVVGDLYEHREARDEEKFPENMTVCRLLWGVSVPEFF
jgi:uncharacterized phiE125 gp8 family phage protein